LVRVGSQESLEPAVELLKGTRFYPVLQDGLAEYKQTGRLSDLEKHLKRFRLKYLASLIYKDSLGIGVFLGYVALKINEINNLRWITHAINLGLNAGEIKGELEFVA
jgi:vacuolar-type H+-ATPase subunit C/Vma6